MASNEKKLPKGEVQETDTPQAITITIMDPSTLGSSSLDTSSVTSVKGQGSSDLSEGHEPTVAESDVGDEECPIISSISIPEEEEGQTSMHGSAQSENIEAEEDSFKPHCLVCNLDLKSGKRKEQVQVFKAVTSTTQRRAAVFLSSLIGHKLTSRKAHSDLLCRRCFNLLDRVDSLEVELQETKEEIVNKYQETRAEYGGRARKRRSTAAKKTDYLYPKVELQEEPDELMSRQLAHTLEAQDDHLMDDSESSEDREWEPLPKKLKKIKKETEVMRDKTSFTGSPVKKKKGRPRKNNNAKSEVSSEEGAEEDLQFHLIDDATSRGNTLLVDSVGYTYTQGRGNLKGMIWRCAVRNSKTYCRSVVRQNGCKFLPGTLTHCHSPDKEALPMAKAFSMINRELRARPLESASVIAKEVISSQLSPGDISKEGRRKLIRRAFYHRRCMQPESNSKKIVKELVDEGPSPWTFEVVEDGTRRGKPRLLDSRGYSYTRSKGSNKGYVWRCVLRSDKMYCKATVRQCGFVFTCGTIEHCHPPEVGALTKTKVLSRLSREAKSQPYEPASSIAKRVLASEFPPDSPNSFKLSNLIRTVNYQRRVARPKNPVSLDFETNESAIPVGFLKGDIFITGKRHLLFSTPSMLFLLSQAQMWYTDIRFSLTSDPFQQLFSLHVFIKSKATSKQIPLLFVLMSDNRKEDYAAVLLKVLELLPAEPNVHSITLDFEEALWCAAIEILPAVNLYGSHFSWNQTIWEKIGELDLVTSYHESDSTQRFCKQLMALPFLPEACILNMFCEFTDSTEGSSQCYKELVNFVKYNWLHNTLWPPSQWSVYKRPIRTKDDIDGWLKRVTQRSHKKSMGFYQLIGLLFKEYFFEEKQVTLVTDEELIRCQKAKFLKKQAKLFESWDSFGKNELSSLDLLNAVTLFNGPDLGED